jgi:hypothetical protein
MAMVKLPDDLFLTDPPDDLKQLYCAIGRLVTNWALVEYTLDMCIAIIFSSYWGSELNNYEMPVTLKKKIIFWRKALKNIDSLLPFKDEGLELITKVSNLKNKRHDMVHSILIDSKPNSFDFRKFNYKMDGEIKIPHVKINDLLQTGNKMLVLVEELSHFFRRLLRQV